MPRIHGQLLLFVVTEPKSNYNNNHLHHHHNHNNRELTERFRRLKALYNTRKYNYYAN